MTKHPECAADGCRLKEHKGYTTCDRSGECDMEHAERIAEVIHRNSGACIKVEVIAAGLNGARSRVSEIKSRHIDCAKGCVVLKNDPGFKTALNYCASTGICSEQQSAECVDIPREIVGHCRTAGLTEGNRYIIEIWKDSIMDRALRMRAHESEKRAGER